MNADWYYFNSPNYPRSFEEGQECSWLLKVIFHSIDLWSYSNRL